MTYHQKQFWIAQQDWEDVLFIHFPVPFELLREQVPKPLQLETYHSQAWMSFVLLKSKNSQLRGIPMSYPSFFQLNMRTYVNCNGMKGIYFLSIDANSLPAVLGAKLLSIPQHYADINVTTSNGSIFFSVKRNKSEAELLVQYCPLNNHIHNEHQSLSRWLTERYFMWFIKGNKIVRGTISHEPWILKSARLDTFRLKGFLSFLSEINLGKCVIHFANRKHAYVHPFKVDGLYK